eukprot:m.157294 g.157294  ORF g.157294 m.157294 type:complete len:2197 (+) comp9809_c2_seq2:51-6641(+)
MAAEEWSQVAGALGLDEQQLSAYAGDSALEPLMNSIAEYVAATVDLRTRLADAESEKTQVQATFDQEFIMLERRVVDTEARLEARNTLCAKLEQDLKNNEGLLESTRTQLAELQNQRGVHTSAAQELHQTSETLKEDLRQAREQAERLRAERESLKVENDELFAKQQAQGTELTTLRLRLDELLSQDASSKLREGRLQQENALLSEQKQQAFADLDERTRELFALKKAHAAEALAQQHTIDVKTDELARVQRELTGLRDNHRGLLDEVSHLKDRLQESQEFQVSQKEGLEQELATKTKLYTLYKSASDEANAKIDELSHAVRELQTLINDENVKHAVVVQQLADEKAQLESSITHMQETITGLEADLSRASLLAGPQSGGDPTAFLSPTAAVVSSLLKDGLSITEMYAKLVETEGALRAERENALRTEEYLRTILKDVSDKAPVFERQRRDLDAFEKRCQHLTQSLDKANHEFSRLEESLRAAERRAVHSEHEAAVLNGEVVQLSEQVRVLLHENELLRGGSVVDADVNEGTVSVRSIHEMQEQNVQLRRLVQTLQDQQSEQVQARLKDVEAANSSQMDALRQQMEQLITERRRHEGLYEAVIRQRDMFRTLYTDVCRTHGVDDRAASSIVMASQPATPAKPGAAATESPSVAATPRTTEPSQSLRDLQQSFEKYREEQSKNTQMLVADLEKSRTEANALRLDSVKLTSQLEFLTLSLTETKSMLESSKAESEQTRQRNSEVYSNLLVHQQRLEEVERSLMESREGSRSLQVQLDNALREKELLASSESRLEAEIKTLRSENQSSNACLLAVQSLQNDFQRSANEHKTRLQAEVDSLQRERDSLRKRLEAEDDRYKALIAFNQQTMDQLRADHTAEHKAYTETREALIKSTCSEENLAKELTTVRGQLAATEQRLSLLLQGKESDSPSHSEREQLQKAMAEIQALQDQLRAANEQAAQFKSISQASEEYVRDLNKTSEEYRTAVEARIAELTRDLEAARTQLQQEVAERDQLGNRVVTLENELNDANRGYLDKLQAAEMAASASASKEAEAVRLQEEAQRQCATQMALARDHLDKYQREVMLHGADLSALTAAREQTDALRKELLEAQSQQRVAEQALASSKASWAEQRRMLDEDLGKLQLKVDDLEKQNTLLHKHLEYVSAEALRAQRAVVPSSPAGGAVPESDAARGTEELLEVVRYQRSKAQIAETELEQARLESLRLQQQVEHLTRQLDEARRQLADERERTQLSVQTSQQFEDMARKVAHLNALEDSVKYLRIEKDKLLEDLKAAKKEIASLQESIQPIQAENRRLNDDIKIQLAEKNGLVNESARWRDRALALRDQYQKIDPEEHNRLLEEKATFEATRKALEDEVETLKKEFAQLKESSEATAAELNKKVAGINRQGLTFKRKSEQLEKDLAARDKELEDLKTALAAAQAPSTANAELEEIKAKLAAGSDELKKLQETETKQKGMLNKLIKLKKDNESKIAVLEASNTALQESQRTVQEEKAALETRVSEITIRLAEQEVKLGESQTQVNLLTTKLKQLQSRKPPAATPATPTAAQSTPAAAVAATPAPTAPAVPATPTSVAASAGVAATPAAPVATPAAPVATPKPVKATPAKTPATTPAVSPAVISTPAPAATPAAIPPAATPAAVATPVAATPSAAAPAATPTAAPVAISQAALENRAKRSHAEVAASPMPPPTAATPAPKRVKRAPAAGAAAAALASALSANAPPFQPAAPAILVTPPTPAPAAVPIPPAPAAEPAPMIIVTPATPMPAPARTTSSVPAPVEVEPTAVPATPIHAPTPVTAATATIATPVTATPVVATPVVVTPVVVTPVAVTPAATPLAGLPPAAVHTPAAPAQPPTPAGTAATSAPAPASPPALPESVSEAPADAVMEDLGGEVFEAGEQGEQQGEQDQPENAASQMETEEPGGEMEAMDEGEEEGQTAPDAANNEPPEFTPLEPMALLRQRSILESTEVDDPLALASQVPSTPVLGGRQPSPVPSDRHEIETAGAVSEPAAAAGHESNPFAASAANFAAQTAEPEAAVEMATDLEAAIPEDDDGAESEAEPMAAEGGEDPTEVVPEQGTELVRDDSDADEGVQEALAGDDGAPPPTTAEVPSTMESAADESSQPAADVAAEPAPASETPQQSGRPRIPPIPYEGSPAARGTPRRGGRPPRGTPRGTPRGMRR